LPLRPAPRSSHAPRGFAGIAVDRSAQRTSDRFGRGRPPSWLAMRLDTPGGIALLMCCGSPGAMIADLCRPRS
jgi:hypothetical protein